MTAEKPKPSLKATIIFGLIFGVLYLIGSQVIGGSDYAVEPGDFCYDRPLLPLCVEQYGPDDYAP